ncbi:formimidoylglutamase [Enterovibrio norvegicus]|uniref:formimidoylglutamase n=1 Tax=Enterovibrio norvegicus TaxID=188144 RepID=UPI000C857F85|nr:formimidoylglutamase [Enterovibrio norvegicus]MCC4797088.1 formimidoylglutamase [Enterovibrio norvegicus]PMI34440.1 formimidoylglutamase [Enterovibrio norvegicus]TKF35200.1 formimidoylglutamase [Enterovibrio norvegicus]
MPIDMSVWQGRMDSEDGDAGRRIHQVVSKLNDDVEEGIALFGFCTDEGVRRNKGRVGAKASPQLIRQALANLPLHHALPFYDGGDVDCDDGNLVDTQQAVSNKVTHALQHHHFPLVLGGGHEIAWASFQGLSAHCLARHPHHVPRIGIINFDAHFDLRTPSGDAVTGSSGTPFSQIADWCQTRQWPFLYACLGVSRSSNTQALFNKADTLNVLTVEDTDIAPHTLNNVAQSLAQFMDSCDYLYLTIDMDVFPASVAPGVSAPATHGVGYPLVEHLIKQVLSAKDENGEQKIRLADIAEFNPNYDIDNHTARLAARLVWTITRGLSPRQAKRTDNTRLDSHQINTAHCDSQDKERCDDRS